MLGNDLKLLHLVSKQFNGLKQFHNSVFRWVRVVQYHMCELPFKKIIPVYRYFPFVKECALGSRMNFFEKKKTFGAFSDGHITSRVGVFER